MRARLNLLAAGVSLCALLAAAGARAQDRDSLLIDMPAAAPVAAPPAGPAQTAAKPAAKPEPKAETEAPAATQDEPQAREAAPRVVPLADARGPDESALRYYASLQQTQRVETEIKRLQRLYPDWTPPDNIYNTPGASGADEQAFWDLFALGRMEQLRADIDKRMKTEPGWQPSADLMSKIKRKENRVSITALWKEGKFKDIVAFIKGNTDAAGEEADVDILWTVAEAYAKTKQTPDALNIYKSILKTNREPEQRLATVQKAMGVLRMSDVEELIAMAKMDSRGRSEFDSINIDIIRGRISAFLHDERSEPIPDDQLKAFEEYARKDSDPNQAGLVAWYYYKTKSVNDALEWFKFAITQGGDAMIAHGLAHSLRELGLYRETEEVAYAWREPLVNNSILFIDILERDLTKEIPPYIEPERLLRYAQVTMDNAAGEGAQGLAWYAYNSCQFQTAHEWFERAVAWLPKEATVYGYALTLQKLKKSKEFWEVVNRYDGLFPKVIEIIYPDDQYHPPTPCDLMDARGKQRPAQKTRQGANVPAPYVPGQPVAGMPPQANPYGAPPVAPAPGQIGGAYSPYPAAAQAPAAPLNPYLQPGAPQQQAGQPGYYSNPDQAYRREPRIDRKNFPVAVDVQNPLRHYPTGRYMGQQAAAARASVAQSSPLVTEPPIIMRQLVARRVPDVTRMPYERWGYSLLPGYNGINAATGPHSAEKAAEGTLWTTLQANDAKSTRGGAFDPLRQDMAALAQHMQSIPRVPPPSASVTGPWRSPAPYKSREQLEAEGLVAPRNVSAGPADIREPSIAPSAGANAAGPIPAAQPRAPDAAVLPAAATSPGAAARPAPAADVPQQPQARATSAARDTLAVQATEFYNRKQFDQALEALDKRAQSMAETTDLRLVRAWSLLNLNRVDEAKRVFGTLASSRGANAAGNRTR